MSGQDSSWGKTRSTGSSVSEEPAASERAGHLVVGQEADSDGWVTENSQPGRRSQGGRSYRQPTVISEDEITVNVWAVVSLVVAVAAGVLAAVTAAVVFAQDERSEWFEIGGWAVTQGWFAVILVAIMVLASAGALLLARTALRQIRAAAGRQRGVTVARIASVLAWLAVMGGLVILGAYLVDNPPELPEWS